MFAKRFKNMGNSMYRISPRKIYNATSGSSAYFQFAANQITGWRNSQEDRYVCLPNFNEDLSLFAVYDGHGGEEVVQYLERFLHQFISRELELTEDVELALYLSFLNCDSSIRSISDAEFTLIENDLVKEFEVPDKAERRRVLFGALDVAGTSGENPMQNEFRAAIASACIKELSSISYLTQAPVQESDESDDDYKPGDEDINFFTDEMDSSDPDQSSDSSESYTTESIEDEIEKSSSSTFKEAAGSTVKEVTGKKKKHKCNVEQKDFGKQIGIQCGSTATVLLINPTRIFIAHVGDSRCVACINGQAVDLTTDHRPNDKEEFERIINAGGSVSEDGRVQGDIDMSRAFGDFRHKAVDDPNFQMLSVEPCISSFEISPDLEFIIVASDGVWNTMNSADVIHYIQKRISDPSLELQDLCGELFEELLPESITTDGSGCDNMTAVIINFNSTQGLSNKNEVCYQNIYQYKYPPINNKSDNSSANNKSKNSSAAENSKESSQLKLDEKKLNYKIITSTYEYKIHSSKSSGKSKVFSESKFGEKKASYEIQDEKEFNIISSKGRYSSQNSKKYSNSEEKIPTHQKQQLCGSNEYCNPATSKAAQTDQHKLNPSKSCNRKYCTSNFFKNCHPKSSVPLQPTNNMDKLLQSLKGVESAIHCLNQNVSSIKAEVKKEIMRINNPYPTNSTSTATQTPMQMEVDLVGHTKENMQTTEQSVERAQIVSQVDCAAVQSHSMQMETDLVSVTNERRENPEQSVEDSECVIIPSPKQIEVIEIDIGDNGDNDITELSFFVKQPVAEDKINSQRADNKVIKSHATQIKADPGDSTNEEVKPSTSQSVGSAIVQSHTVHIEMDPVDRSNKVKTSEQGKVVESTGTESSTMHVRNLVNPTNEDKQATGDSGKKKTPAKERNQFGR